VGCCPKWFSNGWNALGQKVEIAISIFLVFLDCIAIFFVKIRSHGKKSLQKSVRQILPKMSVFPKICPDTENDLLTSSKDAKIKKIKTAFFQFYFLFFSWYKKPLC
jgi:hypothetical protein